MIWIFGGEMGTANSHLIARRDGNLLKILLAINFVILLVMISPWERVANFTRPTGDRLC